MLTRTLFERLLKALPKECPHCWTDLDRYEWRELEEVLKELEKALQEEQERR